MIGAGVAARRLCAVVLLLTLSLVGATGLRAEIVADLYSAEVPVAQQSASALARGARDALSQVLVKVSGSYDLLENPSILAALKESRSHVQQYAYVRGDTLEKPLLARFEFDHGFVTELVAQAGAPLWTANRPLVVAWITLEDQHGQRFLNWETSPAEAQILATEFSRRGVPVKLPLFDLADTAAVSVQDVQRRNTTILQAASQRYQVENILVGSLTVLSAGNLVGDWTYFHLAQRTDRSVNTPNMTLAMREGVAIIAQKMAARYAIAATGETLGGVPMTVAGVHSYADYAGIVSWLESLELIDSANVQGIRGDRLELRLVAQTDAAQLAAIIELNSRLQPVPSNQIPAVLSYLWLN